MARDLCISNGSKEEKYRTLSPQIECLIAGKDDLITNLANVVAALEETFSFFWVGSCLMRDEELVLTPLQGPVACTRVKKKRGVYGKAWERTGTSAVPDVDTFLGHITCSSLSRSEIVILLLWTDGGLWGMPDVDCKSLNGLDDVGTYFLRELCSCL